jgi:hypothetical protein
VAFRLTWRKGERSKEKKNYINTSSLPELKNSKGRACQKRKRHNQETPENSDKKGG